MGDYKTWIKNYPLSDYSWRKITKPSHLPEYFSFNDVKRVLKYISFEFAAQ